MRVLFLFVLVLSVILMGVQVEAQCSSSGTLEGSYCNCYAGTAPDYTQGADNCQKKLTTCVSGNADSDLTSGFYAPSLMDSSAPVKFAQDRVIISFVQPVVQLAWYRRESYIKFFPGASSDTTPGDNSCSYPGSMWTKTATASTCEDEYTFSMPWSSYGTCGFQKAVTPSTLTYTTTVQFTYKEVSDSSATNTRTLSNLFTINIQLVRQTAIIASLNLALASTSDAEVDAVVVGNSAYDLLSGQTRLVFQTQTSWPYQIGSSITIPSTYDPILISTPEDITAVVSPDYLTPDNCPPIAGAICIQQFEIIITRDAVTVCDFYGDYLVGTQLVCADTDSCTPSTGPNITISIDHTNVCAPPTVDTGVSTTQSLLSFGDNGTATPQTDFDTGDTSFWHFTIIDPMVSIDSVTLNTVTLTLVEDPTHPDVLYQSGVASAALVNIAEANKGTYPAGTPVVVAFGLQLNRGHLLNTVNKLTPGDSIKSMTLVVNVDVQYHGNQKRKVTALVSPANNGVASTTATFVVRSKEYSQTIAENKAAQTNNKGENKQCTGFSCVALSLARKVMGAFGF